MPLPALRFRPHHPPIPAGDRHQPADGYQAEGAEPVEPRQGFGFAVGLHAHHHGGHGAMVTAGHGWWGGFARIRLRRRPLRVDAG
ncbi:MAG TPA: hypothetical protein VGN19_03080 [Pedococcus sp.]|nr:hypothetical protein [Pedococcus sp.]